MELRRGRDGQLLPYFYGRFKDANGKNVAVNCGEWRGTPPPSGRLVDEGNHDFEAARKDAQAKLDAFIEEARRKGRADHLTERLIESKTGRAVEYVRLADLADRWRGIDRDGGAPTERHLQWCDSVFRRFAAAVPCESIHEVTPEHVKTFVADIRAGHSEKTVHDMVTVLSGAFARLLPSGCVNPFKATIRRKRARGAVDGGAVGRRPLTDAELQTLFETARPDPLL